MRNANSSLIPARVQGLFVGPRRLHVSRILATSMTAVGIAIALIALPRVDVSTAAAYVAVVMVTVGLLTGLIATKLERVEHGLIKSLGLAKDFAVVGLTELCQDSASFDYMPLISNSQRLVIVLNDGRTWLSGQRDRLRRRLADPNKETIVFLIHPASPMIGVLARKGQKDADTLRRRIAESVEILRDISTPGASLEILGHHLFNPFSVVLGDKTAVTCPYFASRGGRMTPVFKFEDVGDDCYFRALSDDLDRLRMDAENIAGYGVREKDDTVDSLRLIRPTR